MTRCSAGGSTIGCEEGRSADSRCSRWNSRRSDTRGNHWRVVVFLITMLTLITLLSSHLPPIILDFSTTSSTPQYTFSRFLSSPHPPVTKLPLNAPPTPVTKHGPHHPPPKLAPLFNNSTRMSLYNETDILKYSLQSDSELRSHIRQAGFLIVDTSPHEAFGAFKIHSVRSGSTIRLDGIGSKCDWSITWNGELYGVTSIPRIVCLGTRQIEKFWLLVPHLTRSRFILVTAGGDRLYPLGNAQYGAGYKGFGGEDGGPGWKIFTESPNILHVFSENHNKNHSRLSTLPCGFPHTTTTNPSLHLKSIQTHLKRFIPFEERPLRVLVSDRVRGGPWYRDRYLAREYCVNVSSSFCSTKLELDHEPDGSHAKFVWSVQNSQFVMCTHGGGLDPSPKAWETVLIGSIPIIEHSTLDDGYIRLPVVIVPNITAFLFNADGQSPLLLDQWLEDLAPHYVEGSVLRKQALHRLTHAYWYDVLKDKYDEVGQQINEDIARGEIPKY